MIVIGAGVAGLSAAAAISRTGRSVFCLEATARVGGRILTVNDPLAQLPIELGAEFVHGRPPEIWNLIREAGIAAFEHTGQSLHLDRGVVVPEKRTGNLAEQLLHRLTHTRARRDESFDEYLTRSHGSRAEKERARAQIEGFNAARAERISIQSLGQDERAAEKIDGDRTFRIAAGYHSIPLSLMRSIASPEPVVQLNSVVNSVHWRSGFAKVLYRSTISGREATLQCRQLVITVPLGILQAKPPGLGVIDFNPEPTAILQAARKLEFGQAYRVTLRFKKPFWEEDDRFRQVGFLFSKEARFPTWWTTHPMIIPILTGWTAGSAADQFSNSDSPSIIRNALASLSRILNKKVPDPEAAYFHNWRSDPFFRGAYSYVPVHALAARRVLARPVEDTLFFAGEATETGGHTGTVHGAIASGLRAASAVIQSAK